MSTHDGTLNPSESRGEIGKKAASQKVCVREPKPDTSGGVCRFSLRSFRGAQVRTYDDRALR